jgi:hypothetical protein
VAFVETPVTPAASTLPRQKLARRRLLRAARGTLPMPADPSETSVPVTTDLRLVDEALLDWH